MFQTEFLSEFDLAFVLICNPLCRPNYASQFVNCELQSVNYTGP